MQSQAIPNGLSSSSQWGPQVLVQGGESIPVRDVISMIQRFQESKEPPEDPSKTILLSYGDASSSSGGSTAPTQVSQPNPAPPVAAGCTSIVVLVRDNRVICANAGDSAAVLCRKGIATELSVAHKPLDEKERRRIEQAGGFVSEQGRVNNNLNLSRSIGDLKYKQNRGIERKDQIISAEPDFISLPITPEDEFLIVACDGIWDVVQPQEAVDFVRERMDGKTKLSTICEQLFDRCIAEDPHRTGGLGGDNMTCLIVSLRGYKTD